jgi:hypothetical protein
MTRSTPYIILVGACSIVNPSIALAAPAARGDCDGLQWRSGLQISQGFDTEPSASASIDHDGDGVPTLFVAGSGGAAGIDFQGLVRLVDGAWQPFGPSFSGTVGKIASFDLDGDGVPSLLVLGTLRLSPDGDFHGLLEWSGSGWIARAPGVQIGDALVLDDDGDGAPTLFASIRYASSSGVPPLVRWSGGGWVDMSPSSTVTMAGSQTAVVLGAFDSDGDGTRELFAQVNVSEAGGPVANGMARWNGTAWSGAAGFAPPALFSGAIYSMCVADSDGDGAIELIAAGSLPTVAVGSAPQVVAFDGKSWRGVGGTLIRQSGTSQQNALVRAVAAVDVGATGVPTLFASGYFNKSGANTLSNFARWDGANWVDVAGGLSGGGIGASRGLFGHDMDGDGDLDLAAFGGFGSAGTAIVNGAATFDGTAWSGIGSPAETLGLNGRVAASVLFDHDGDGRESLIAGGRFTQTGATSVPRLASFDGTSWQAIANPWPSGIEELLVADLDGDGQASLYAAGNTGVQIGTSGTARTVAVFNPSKSGGSWTQLPGQFNSTIDALAAVDHDGDGQRSLFVGGGFSTVDGAAVGRLARWTGSAWAAFTVGASNQVVDSIVSFDDDGNGSPSLIIALGYYDPNAFLQRVLKWNGTAWQAVGSFTQGHALALQAFDHDQDGVPSLFVFGQSLASGGLVWAQRLQSAAWTPFGPVTTDYERPQAGAGLVRFDADADGSTELYMHTTDPFFETSGALHRIDGATSEQVASLLAEGPARAFVADLDGDGRASLHLDGGLRARAGACGSGIAIIDSCLDACPADLDGDGDVGASDLSELLAAWGACGGGCAADIDASGDVGAADLSLLLAAWGACS